MVGIAAGTIVDVDGIVVMSQLVYEVVVGFDVVVGVATGTIVDVDVVVVGGCKQSWHRLMTPRHVVKYLYGIESVGAYTTLQPLLTPPKNQDMSLPVELIHNAGQAGSHKDGP